MATAPLLSICIPTFNRAPYLRECLASIVPQIKKYNLFNDVDVIIADNASTDQTAAVVAEYMSQYPESFTYFRNEMNLGFDRSFTRLIERSQGTFCLCLGDDDALFEDSLVYLVNILKKNQDIGLVWVNNWGYDRELKKPLLPQPNLPPKPDKLYPSLTSYIQSFQPHEELVGFFVGLSNQLFRREDWVRYTEKEKFYDTQAIHMYVCLSVFADAAFMLITKPVVKTRASNIRWNVFAGLETVQGRIQSTTQIAHWICIAYKLPISKMKLRTRIACKEYWATLKETLKSVIQKIGFTFVISWYRTARNQFKVFTTRT